jgi:hypothetical protein
MPEHALLVTGIAGADNCAAVASKQFSLTVEAASSRKDALAALRRKSYASVVLDSSLLETAEMPMPSSNTPASPSRLRSTSPSPDAVAQYAKFAPPTTAGR